MGNLGATQRYAMIVGVVVIVAIVFLIANGTFELGGSDDDGPLAVEQVAAELDEEDEASADEESGDDDAPSRPAAGLQPMEVAFQFGDLRIIVTDIRLGDRVGEEDDETLALERFATVELSVRNTGLDAGTLEGALLLIDGSGRRFSPSVAGTAVAVRVDANREDAQAVSLQPGITTALVAVFEIPDEAEDFRLRVSGGYAEVELDR